MSYVQVNWWCRKSKLKGEGERGEGCLGFWLRGGDFVRDVVVVNVLLLLSGWFCVVRLWCVAL